MVVRLLELRVLGEYLVVRLLELRVLNESLVVRLLEQCGGETVGTTCPH